MLEKVRLFFKERSFLEVDCPLISSSASVDAHIDLIPCRDSQGETRYLHSSPEYGMKRLLSEGIGNIYQLSHVFRQGEYGQKHNPEFMMAEWYSLDLSFEQLIEQTLDFIRVFLGPLPSSTLSYRQALKQYVNIDYVHTSPEKLVEFLKEQHVEIYPNIIEEGKDALLNLLLALYVEPYLGKGELTTLAYYPSTQAALAQTKQFGEETVAERFEVYYNGVELANGYHELADPDEQLKRFEEANQHRLRLNKQTLPIDYNFINALKMGLPECCGVAVGFDRLLMLRNGVKNISQVIPFDWSNA